VISAQTQRIATPAPSLIWVNNIKYFPQKTPAYSTLLIICLRLVTIDGSPICLVTCPTTGYFKKSYYYSCVAFAQSNCLAPDKDTGCTNSTCCTKATCGTALDYASKYNYCTSDCGIGYFMDTYLTNFKKCTHCSSNCYTCSSLNVCTSCTGT